MACRAVVPSSTCRRLGPPSTGDHNVVGGSVRLGGQGTPPAITDRPGTTMTMTPEFGEEERMRQQSEALQRQSEGVLPQDREDAPDREIEERGREDREAGYLDPEDNEAHAPGQVCARCGAIITAGQDVRLRADGRWVHEVCPPDLGEEPAR